MSLDLHDALTGMATDGGSSGEAPTSRLVSLVHRRRAARTAATSALGAATVGVMALAGVQLVSQPTERVAAPTTAANGPLSLPSFRCLAATPVPAAASDLELVARLGTPTATQPSDGLTFAELDVSLTVRNGTPADLLVRPTSRLGLVAVRDGRIVGVTQSSGAVDGLLVAPLAPGGEWTTEMTYLLGGCQIPVQLGAGSYSLYAALVVEDDADGSEVELISEPVPFTITETPQTQAELAGS